VPLEAEESLELVIGQDVGREVREETDARVVDDPPTRLAQHRIPFLDRVRSVLDAEPAGRHAVVEQPLGLAIVPL
jgi:hypothetical protein